MFKFTVMTIDDAESEFPEHLVTADYTFEQACAYASALTLGCVEYDDFHWGSPEDYQHGLHEIYCVVMH